MDEKSNLEINRLVHKPLQGTVPKSQPALLQSLSSLHNIDMSLLRTLRPVLASARSVSVSTRFYSSHHSPPSSDQSRKKVTIPELDKMRRNGEKISMVTAHDYVTGLIADKAGIDMILVGDSLAMVALGYPNTNQIELEEMYTMPRLFLEASRARLWLRICRLARMKSLLRELFDLPFR